MKINFQISTRCQRLGDSIQAEQALQKKNFFNRGDDDSSNNFFTPPLPPPPPNFPNLRLSPLLSDLFNIPNRLRVDKFLNNNDFNFPNSCVTQASDPHQLGDLQDIFFPNRPSTAKTLSNVGTNTTQEMIEEPERVIEKEKPKEKIIPDENIILSLPKIPTILDNEDFEIKQEIKKTKITRQMKKQI